MYFFVLLIFLIVKIEGKNLFVTLLWYMNELKIYERAKLRNDPCFSNLKFNNFIPGFATLVICGFMLQKYMRELLIFLLESSITHSKLCQFIWTTVPTYRQPGQASSTIHLMNMKAWRQKRDSVQNKSLPSCRLLSSFLFTKPIIFLVVDGFWAMAWVSYIIHSFIIATVRQSVREHLSIPGIQIQWGTS